MLERLNDLTAFRTAFTSPRLAGIWFKAFHKQLENATCLCISKIQLRSFDYIADNSPTH